MQEKLGQAQNQVKKLEKQVNDLIGAQQTIKDNFNKMNNLHSNLADETVNKYYFKQFL